MSIAIILKESNCDFVKLTWPLVWCIVSCPQQFQHLDSGSAAFLRLFGQSPSVLSDGSMKASWMVSMAALLCLTQALRKDDNPDFVLDKIQQRQVPDVPPVLPEEAAAPNLEQIMHWQKELAGGSWRWSRMATQRLER